MEPIEVISTVLVGLFGLSYPVLLQIVSGLDDRYESTKITEYFRNQRSYFVFRVSLWSSFGFMLIYFFKLPPPSYAPFSTILKDSAFFLLFITTLTALVSFFLCVESALVFVNPFKFTSFLKTKFEAESGMKQMKTLSILSDLVCINIRKENEDILKTILNFVSEKSDKLKSQNHENKIEYPLEYYNFISKALTSISNMPARTLPFLKSLLMADLLFKKREENISEVTYSWLWYNIVISIESERDDLVVAFWKRAHKYYSDKLDYVREERSEDYHIILNQPAIDERNSERKRFIEFTTALGGLLLYKKRYDVLKRIFNYTTSIPPRYELLPVQMDQIFADFMIYRDPYNHEMTTISYRYPFPEQDGLKSDDNVKFWICKYLAVLFHRQYSIAPYHVLPRPLDNPLIPDTQGGKRKWIDLLPSFERLIIEIYNDREILRSLDLDFITPEYCRNQTKPTPIVLIGQIIQQVRVEYGNQEITQNVAPAKRLAFENSSRVEVKSSIDLIDKFKNSEKHDGKLRKFKSGFLNTVVSKSAFALDQGVDHGNYDTFLGRGLASSILEDFANTFEFITTKRYCVKEEELFSAIDRLKLNEDFVLVVLGLNFNYLVEKYKIETPQTAFKNIQIIDDSKIHSNLTRNSIYFLRRTDLPNINILQGFPETIKKFDMKAIPPPSHLYASILDLNQNEALRKSIQQNEVDDLRPSVLLNLYIDLEFAWKSNAQIVKFDVATSYRSLGIPVNLNEIKIFDENFKDE